MSHSPLCQKKKSQSKTNLLHSTKKDIQNKASNMKNFGAENFISEAVILNKMNANNVKENTQENCDEEYDEMLTYLQSENYKNEVMFLQTMEDYFKEIKSVEKIQKIEALLEMNTNNLIGNPKYTYEFVLIHYGATLHARDTFNHIDKAPKSASIKLQNWWNNGGKWLWFKIMQKIYKNHNKCYTDALKLMNDKRLIERFQRLMCESQPFKKKEYQYEFILTSMGAAIHGRKEGLAEFKNLKKIN